MQFDDLVAGDARRLVQPVDILGDDGGDLAAPHQRIDRAVAAVGFGRLEDVLHREAPPPGFAARLLGGQELVEIDRRHLRPDAARAAEIGYAGLGADAGAGEHDGAARLLDQPLQRGDFWIVSHALLWQNRRTPPSPPCQFTGQRFSAAAAI